MADRAALVTGASSGIGLAIAKVLGEEGYALTVAARRPEKLEEAAEGLRGEGFEVEPIPANMAEEDHVVAIFAAHRQKFGRLDVLVNNAGVGIGAPMEQIQTKHLDMQLAVNLRALILGTREGPARSPASRCLLTPPRSPARAARPGSRSTRRRRRR